MRRERVAERLSFVVVVSVISAGIAKSVSRTGRRVPAVLEYHMLKVPSGVERLHPVLCKLQCRIEKKRVLAVSGEKG